MANIQKSLEVIEDMAFLVTYERFRVGPLTYITTGGGGAPLYPCVRPAPGLRRCVPAHHFLLIAATRSRVVVRAVTPNGRTLERVVLPVRAP